MITLIMGSIVGFSFYNSKEVEYIHIEPDLSNINKSLFIGLSEIDDKSKSKTQHPVILNYNEFTETEDETEVFEEEVNTYTEEELEVLSRLIMGEAEGESWEHKVGVGSVVLNRVKDDRFPDTIKEVAFQERQYACTWDGNYDKTPNKESVEVAKFLLENGSQYPEYVLFQANFKQGNRVYKQIGNTYFCYWKKDVK